MESNFLVATLSKIKTLWIGANLGKIERLALKSFLYYGHEVTIFVYDDVAGIPNGVKVRDANEILTSQNIFRYKNNNSVAGFADWFRYEMLYREGGVWVDTDVVCLKPFEFSGLFFGREQYDKYNNAVLGAVPGCKFMRFLSDQAAFPNRFLPFDTLKDKKRKLKRRLFRGNKPRNVSWGEVGPVGLTRAINHFNLNEFGFPAKYFYPIHPFNWDQIFDNSFPNPSDFFPDSFAIHLWNEMFKTKPGFDKNQPSLTGSLIHALEAKYS